MNFLNFYEDHGYAVIRNTVDQKYIDEWLKLYQQASLSSKLIEKSISIEDYYKQKPEMFLEKITNFKKIDPYILSNPGSTFPSITSLLAEENIWRIASQTLDTSLNNICFNFLNFTRKPALYGPALSFHRDYNNKYIKTKNPQDMIRIIIPLQECDNKSGAIAFINHSHKKNNNIPVNQKLCIEQSVTPATNIGDIIIFNSQTIHGSMHNKSQKDRINVVIQFAKSNVEYEFNCKDEPFNKCSYKDFFQHSIK